MFYYSNKGSRKLQGKPQSLQGAQQQMDFSHNIKMTEISLITGFVVITHGVKGKGDIHIC